MEITVTLTELNKEIDHWQNSIRSITGSGGRITPFTESEESRLKSYEKELKKWEDLRNSMLE